MKNFGFNFDGDRENATVQLTIRSALDDSTSLMLRKLYRRGDRHDLNGVTPGEKFWSRYDSDKGDGIVQVTIRSPPEDDINLMLVNQ